jgi:superfamily II DNA/RNA helicase
MQGIPILFEKRDAIVLAETGSGKSLTFIAPLIHMHRKGDGIKAIIVAPTRELAIQLYKEFLIFSDLIGNSKTLKK